MSGIMQMLLAAVQRVTDPFFEYVTLLLPGNGTNGAQNNTFLDGSTNNFTITRNGNTTQGTFSPFSQTGWSNYFDGTGDYLSLSYNSAFDITSGDFTVELWVYRTVGSAEQYLFSQRQDSPSRGWEFRLNNTNVAQFFFVGGSSITGSGTIPTNTWTHLAVTRSSNTVRLFINGTQDASATFANGTATTSALYLGYGTTGGGLLTGYISNARIVKGTAVYTAAFTPPTAPLTAITNTSLLTCQSNRFIDNSTNNFAITRNGDVSVQAFSPFNPTAAWSAATNGGSGYFDGSGDALTAADNAALDMGSSNFTIECWAYLTTTGSDYGIVSKWNQWGTAGTNSYLLYYSSAGNLEFLVSTGGTIGDIVLSSAATLRNTWVHIAAVRSGSNFALFANGTRLATASSASSVYDSTQLLRVGEIRSSVSNFPGYLSNVRIVKGTAVYDPTQSTLTVPTAPLTAIANTQLLLSCTNAGIYDATSKNDLETVGNAQISTTQSKFGGSSMYFDGTGDYLAAPARQYLAFPGDFTIEFWLYLTAVSGEGTAFYVTTSGGVNLFLNISSNWGIARSGIAIDNNFGTPPSQNTWNHIAVSRNGSTIRAFINGTQAFSGSNSVSYADGPVQIGASGFGTITGYINDLRVTRGVARYTSTFTPPAAAFPVL